MTGVKYDIERGLHVRTGCELHYSCFFGDWNLKAPESEEGYVMLFQQKKNRQISVQRNCLDIWNKLPSLRSFLEASFLSVVQKCLLCPRLFLTSLVVSRLAYPQWKPFGILFPWKINSSVLDCFFSARSNSPCKCRNICAVHWKRRKDTVKSWGTTGARGLVWKSA